MRWFVLRLALIASLLFVLVPSTAHASKGTCAKHYSRADFHAGARSYFYRPTPAKQRTLRRLVRCQRSARSRRLVRFHLRRYRRSYERRQAVARVTPYPGPNGTHWAIPWAIVACESHGDFHAYNGVLGAGGAYQIIPGTWAAHGGRAFAPAAHMSAPYGQHVVASRIWANGAGRGQWAC